MRFDPALTPARLIRRYKRFLADAVLEDGTEVTVHCPNPGTMTGLAEPDSRIWLQPATGRGRKLAWGWRVAELADGHFAGIDTGVPNRIVAEALAAGAIPELAAWPHIRAEVRYGARSRVDFLLSGPGLPDHYVEVKNVHLRRDGSGGGLAEFPDCVTARGARHLDELAAMVAAGHRASLLYVVQRTDCDRFAVAADLDPAYAAAHARAGTVGVAMLCHRCRVSPDGVWLDAPLPHGA